MTINFSAPYNLISYSVSFLSHSTKESGLSHDKKEKKKNRWIVTHFYFYAHYGSSRLFILLFLLLTFILQVISASLCFFFLFWKGPQTGWRRLLYLAMN
jgi:hypothetical protein